MQNRETCNGRRAFNTNHFHPPCWSQVDDSVKIWGGQSVTSECALGNRAWGAKHGRWTSTWRGLQRIDGQLGACIGGYLFHYQGEYLPRFTEAPGPWGRLTLFATQSQGAANHAKSKSHGQSGEPLLRAAAARDVGARLGGRSLPSSTLDLQRRRPSRLHASEQTHLHP